MDREETQKWISGSEHFMCGRLTAQKWIGRVKGAKKKCQNVMENEEEFANKQNKGLFKV